MLERYFNDPTVVERLRGEPLGSYLDSFAASLAHLGYAAETIRCQIRVAEKLGRWLAGQEVGVTDLEESGVDAFLDEECSRGCRRRGDQASLHRLLEHLRQEGVVPLRELNDEQTALTVLESRYEQCLREERGVTTATVRNYLPYVHRFLVERFDGEPLSLRKLGSSDSSKFILRYARSMSLGRAKLMVTALRSFFRFLLEHGEIDVDLAASVPAVSGWRQATLPKYLSSEEVERFLGACDRNSAVGRRNYAILLLLARLGLRAGEIVALELDDVDWRAGEITLHGKGSMHDQLPLPPDVGEAVANYLRQDRPRCATRRVFIRARAPHRGFVSAAAVTTIVERAVNRAGLHPPVRGAHLLRHSLASGMLQRGASMAEIGQVLRHRAAQTTEIYAKVDFEGLRTLAQRWPGVEVKR